ncbi:TetR/AcrR family transcriptional regulator [Salinarchaeum chitinilyticum]
MATQVDLFTDPETSEEEIFRATYQALTRHGLADLSIQQIADEATLGKSTIYHHFDSKDDLLTSFVSEFMRAHVDALLIELPEGGLQELFAYALDIFITGEAPDGTERAELDGADIDQVYLQLRAQAAMDPAYKTAMAEADAVARERMADLAELAIDEGFFREDADPQRVAATLYAFIETSLLVQSTSDDVDWLRHVRASADDYMESIVAEDVEWQRSEVLARDDA